MGMIAAGFGWMCVTALLLAGGQPEGLASLSVVSATLTTAGILSSLPDDGLPERANGWSHAPTPRGSEQLRAQGPLAAAEELRAPLSDRRCLAYELGVRHDSDPRGELGSWTLLEQRSAAGLSVDAVELDEVPYLRVERQIYAQELDARARRVLRERGLDPERPGYTLFETIIEPDAHAQLFAHSGGLVVTLA